MPEGCFPGPCKRCRLHRQHWIHDYTYNCWSDPEHPELESHSFEPELEPKTEEKP